MKAARLGLLDEGQHEATAGELLPRELQRAGRQPNPALEAAVRNLEAVNDRTAYGAGQRAAAGDHDDVRLEIDFDTLRLHSGKRREYQHLAFGLENVDRRLPPRRLSAGQIRLE